MTEKWQQVLLPQHHPEPRQAGSEHAARSCMSPSPHSGARTLLMYPVPWQDHISPGVSLVRLGTCHLGCHHASPQAPKWCLHKDRWRFGGSRRKGDFSKGVGAAGELPASSLGWALPLCRSSCLPQDGDWRAKLPELAEGWGRSLPSCSSLAHTAGGMDPCS